MARAPTRWLTGVGLALVLVVAVLLLHGGSPSAGSADTGRGDATPSLAVSGMPAMPLGDDGGGCGALAACCLAVLAGVALLALPRAGLGPVRAQPVARPPRPPATSAPPRPPVLSLLCVLRI